MPRTGPSQAVRPLNDGAGPERSQHRPPRLLLVAVLVVAGGFAGWLGASLGNDGPGSIASRDDAAATPPPPSQETAWQVTWTRAASVPEAPSGFEYDGIAGIAEVGGTKYVVINWLDLDTGLNSASLWSSSNDLDWRAQPIDVGESAAMYDFEAVGNYLLVAGTAEGTDKVWRSRPFRARFGSIWSEIPLDIPEVIRRDGITAAVSDQGEVLLTMAGSVDISADVIEPYLPAEIDIDDDQYTYDGGEFVFTDLPRSRIRIFGESPEVVVAGDRVWVRLVTVDGQEIVRTLPWPEGAHVATDRPGPGEIPLLMAWVASDNLNFQPVGADGTLPAGALVPEPWAGGFLGVSYNTQAAHTAVAPALWRSESGVAWSLEELQPPPQCSPFFSAVSQSRIHLRTGDGTQCVRDAGSDWVTLDESGTPAYVVGGPAGFVAYPDDFQYDEALFSADGLNWSEIQVPGLAPYPTMSVLDEHLLLVSVDRRRPSGSSRIEVWVGEVTS